MMTTGLKRHISGRRARGGACGIQGMHFGMRPAGALVPALAHHPAVFHQHAADARVGFGDSHSQRRLLQRPLHPGAMVVVVHRWVARGWPVPAGVSVATGRGAAVDTQET